MHSAVLYRPTRATAGFTLTEILITLGVASLLMVGVLSFFIQGLNMFSLDVGKNLVNRDIRHFTSELTDNATAASYFHIYPNFATRTVTTTTNGVPVTTSAVLEDGQSGDMLVLVFKDPSSVDLVSRIVGYYRAPQDPNDARSKGPVRKFDLRITPATSAAINTLLPAASTYATNEEVIEMSRGLANGRLFYNIRSKSVMVNGEILHRGGLKNTTYDRATNTYNFTISPRG